MQQFLCSLWREEEGQDLTEYSLLVAFIALLTAGLIGSPMKSVITIWTSGNTTLARAAS